MRWSPLKKTSQAIKPRRKLRITQFFPVFAVMFGSLLLTVFIFSQSFELLFTRDIPYTSALETVSVDQYITANKRGTVDQKSFGSFGAPAFLKIGSQKQRLQLIPTATQDNNYIARLAAGHFELLSPNQEGNLGNVFIYMRQGWRTIDSTTIPSVNQNLFLDTNTDWRYMYRITEVLTQPSNDRMITPESTVPRLVLGIVDTANQRTTYVTAEFVTLQNIAQ
jgi:hypothetical protein